MAVSLSPEVDFGIEEVHRVQTLRTVETPNLDPQITVLQGIWERDIPPQYQRNKLAQSLVAVKIYLPDGQLYIPQDPQTSFVDFYNGVKASHYSLHQRIIGVGGTAKSSSTNHLSPIKQLAQLSAAASRSILPSDKDNFGWEVITQETKDQVLMVFQANGLYFNRGSAWFDGKKMLTEPNMSLAEVSMEEREVLGVSEASLKRPLVFITVTKEGIMKPFLFTFTKDESYQQGINRLQQYFKQNHIQGAIAASPPFILPDTSGTPRYLPMEEALTKWAANDVRHYFYCPYQGTALLSAELSRLQALDPKNLVASLSGKLEDRVSLPLKETLATVSLTELTSILDRSGYQGRYEVVQDKDQVILQINLLEGIYSHLLVGLTKKGKLTILQTSGTHGNITGNDGPTFNQLSAILKDINSQPPFNEDPIITAFSGSQGNDVPFVLCAGQDNLPQMLPYSSQKGIALRGTVTTPRVAVVAKTELSRQNNETWYNNTSETI